MKVVLVHDFLLKLGGAERVLKVLSEMFPKAPIFTLLYDEQAVGNIFPKERVNTSFLQDYPDFIKKRHRLLTKKMPRAVEEFNFENFDLVISSSNSFAHGIITPLNTKHLCYCHSPMRYAWDWASEYRKENDIQGVRPNGRTSCRLGQASGLAGGLKSFFYAYLMKYLREWDRVSADRPTSYAANSLNVRNRIKKYYGAESDVIYPPVDTKKFKATGKNSNYFLIVSTLTPYKKIDLAVQFFNKINRRLIIIGDGPQREYLQSIAGDNIDFLGFKDDASVKEYMENCRALIFPGEEDFGIVPVEAMACGKPVLAFGKGGALETVIPGKTGEFFYEPTVESMEDGLARLIYNEKFFKPLAIKRHANKFSREVFEKAIKRKISKL